MFQTVIYKDLFTDQTKQFAEKITETTRLKCHCNMFECKVISNERMIKRKKYVLQSVFYGMIALLGVLSWGESYNLFVKIWN
jgi:hypothetical protein